MPFPDPSFYSDWKDWARAVALELGQDVTAEGGSASSLSGLPILDSSGRPLVTAQGLWIYRDGGRPPISPDLFSIDTLDIADAAIVSSKLGPQAVSNDKLADLAVDARTLGVGAATEEKLAPGSVSATKIALLAVGAGAIQDLAVGTAKIDNLAVVTEKIGDAQIVTAKIADLAVNRAKIANLAVSTAQIDDASITTAKIVNLAVGSAQIADLAVGTAKIDNLAITSAKILELVVDKIASGQLNAVIDVGTGRFQFTVAGSTLVIGNGFGTSNQFFLWYGPSTAITDMSEAMAVLYLKTDGSAYFGGTLSAGMLRAGGTTPSLSSTASFDTGLFGSNGHTISIVLSYSTTQITAGTFPATETGKNDFRAYAASQGATNDGTGYWTGVIPVSGTASITLSRGFAGGAPVVVNTLNISGGSQQFEGQEPVPGASELGTFTITTTYGGSLTYTDPVSSASDRQYVGTITARSLGTPTTQRLAVLTQEAV